MKGIEEYILDLNWNNPEFIQEKAIKELSKIRESEVILIAKQSELCNKYCWHNAAIVLKNIGYPRNKRAIPYLMEWFKDVNWPGISTILQLLKEVDTDILLAYIKCAIDQVLKDQDELWAYGVVYLITELDIQGFELEESIIYKKLIKLAYGE